MTYLGVKFRTVLTDKNFPRHPKIEELTKWCEEFYRHGFTPENEGSSAGNLSFRVDEKEDCFIITAAGLATKSMLSDHDLSQVDSFIIGENIVYYCGLKKPSSESLVHAVVYQARKEINAIFHGHSELIVKNASKLGMVETKKAEPEGTKELAKAVLEVLENNNFIIMKNHGFISLGRTMEEAGRQAIEMQEKAKTA